MSEIRYFTDGEQATAAVLNRPIKDMSLKDSIMSSSTFKAIIESNKAIYPATGFINFGVHYANNVNNKVNDGIWFFDTVKGWENTFALGDEHGNDSGYGDSLSRQPLVNAGGVLLNIESVNENIGYDRNSIKLPPAPDGLDKEDFTRTETYEIGNILSRKDIVGIEVWAENIDKTDMVYPYGNVQYRGGDNWGFGIQEGTFIGKEFYSLFGDWQEADELVGKGYKWSELSDAQKKDFARSKFNNIYTDQEKYYQVRYRIRTIKTNSDSLGGWGTQKYGVGNNAINPNGSSTYGYLSLIGQRYVGSTEKITDWTMENGTNGGYVAYTFDQSYHTKDNGCYAITNSSSGHTFLPTMFIPIGEIQRYNTGIYHPLYNPFGTGTKNFKQSWNLNSPNVSFDESWAGWGYYNNVYLSTQDSDGNGIKKIIVKSNTFEGEHCALYGASSGGFGELAKGNYKIEFRYKMTEGTSPLTWSIRTNNFNGTCYFNDSIKINGEFDYTSTWQQATIEFEVTDDFVNKNVHFWIVGNNGTASGHGDTDTKYHIELFKIEEVNPDSYIINDTFNCFNKSVNSNIATYIKQNPLSMRADEISEYNFHDMRIDAKPARDYEELLEREVNKDFEGTTLGKESYTWGFIEKVDCYLNATNTSHSSMNTGPEGSGDFINWTVSYEVEAYDGVIAIQRATNKMAWGSVSTYDHMRFYPWEEFMGSNLNTMISSVGFNRTDIIEVYLFKKIKHSNIKYKEITELYGNTDNLPLSWKNDMSNGINSLCATPALYQYFNNTLLDREGVLAKINDPEVLGTDYITFSMSRKAKSIYSIYAITKTGDWKQYSYNGGGGDHTSLGYNSSDGGTANRVGLNIDSSWEELGYNDKNDMLANCLFMITYRAPNKFRSFSTPFNEDYGIIKSKYVYGSSTHYTNYGNALAGDLINKVCVSSTSQVDSNWDSHNSRASILRYNASNSNSQSDNGSVFRKVEHTPLNLGCTNNNRFGFKMLPYLFEYHNQLFMGYSFEELINDEEIVATTGSISVSYDNNEVIFKGSNNTGDKFAPEIISTDSTGRIFIGATDNLKAIIRISLSGMNSTEQVKINGEVVYSGLIKTNTERISSNTIDIPYNGQWIDTISVVGPGAATGTVTKIDVIKGQEFGDENRMRIGNSYNKVTDINGNKVTSGTKIRALNIFVKKSYHSFKES